MYFHHDSVGEIKKYCRGNQKASYSQTTNSPAFVCGNAKREREEERKESEMGARGGGGVHLHAEAAGGSCWLVFLK